MTCFFLFPVSIFKRLWLFELAQRLCCQQLCRGSPGPCVCIIFIFFAGRPHLAFALYFFFCKLDVQNTIMLVTSWYRNRFVWLKWHGLLFILHSLSVSSATSFFLVRATHVVFLLCNVPSSVFYFYNMGTGSPQHFLWCDVLFCSLDSGCLACSVLAVQFASGVAAGRSAKRWIKFSTCCVVGLCYSSDGSYGFVRKPFLYSSYQNADIEFVFFFLLPKLNHLLLTVLLVAIIFKFSGQIDGQA